MSTPREAGDTNEKKDRVKGYIRFRPNFDQNGQYYNITPDNRQLHLADGRGNYDKDRWYNFDYIFSPASSNKQVYKVVGHPLVDAALNGINTSLFAYGQTGSGKTHTLMSKDGLTAHMISLMFSKIWNDCYHDYKVTCSYMQIYQEKLYDLLNPNANLELKIREDPNKGPFVENMTSFVCNTPTDVYHLLNLGRRRLVFAETKMNRLSSRSHAICQINIEKKKKTLLNVIGGSVPLCNTPVEISSPRANERPMPQLNEQEFETIPFIPTTLKKRHSIAVSMPTKRNSASSLAMNKKLRLNPSNSRLNSPRDPFTPNSIHKRHSIQLSRAVSVYERTPPTSENKTCLSASSSFRNERPTSGLNRLNIRRSSRPDAADISSFIENRPATPDPLSYDTMMLSNTSLASSRLSNSTDSVIDDMQWQINASTTDISKVFEKDTTSEELLNLSFADGYSTTEESHQDISFQGNVMDENTTEDILLQGKISIIDLAGSERLKKSQAEGERLAETQNINSSLLELGNVVSALADGSRTHIPYRNSLLTRLLQDSIGGNCKTSFVLCTSSAMEDISETKCTLEFGKRLLMISSKPKINVETDYKKLCDELKINIKKLEESKEKDLQELKTKLNKLETSLVKFKENESTQNGLFSNLRKDLEDANKKNDALSDEVHELNTKLEVSQFNLKSKTVENEELLKDKMNSEYTEKISYSHTETNTETIISIDASCNTLSNELKDCHTSPLHSFLQNMTASPFTGKLSDISNKNITENINPDKPNSELKSRVKQMLITELMSLQLLYSMLELNFSKAGTENENTQNQNRRESDSPISSKSSGYLTGSQSHLELERFSDKITKHNELLHAHDAIESPLLARLQSCSSNKGSLLEEIIETNLNKPDENHALEVKRISGLKKELVEHKSLIDDQLQAWLTESISDDSSSKRDLYSKLVYHLTAPSTSTEEPLEKLEQLLDLILVDHSLTGCLLALASSRKNKREDIMMRRLSSIKTNPKSLLDFIDIDAEFHGYDNEAAVFHDNSEEVAVDMQLNEAPDTPEMIQKRNDVIMDDVPIDSDEASDVETDFMESPTVKKRGIRKFLCMPVKSRKPVLKKLKPFKKEKSKNSGSRLLQAED